jgi:hypothetical protein
MMQQRKLMSFSVAPVVGFVWLALLCSGCQELAHTQFVMPSGQEDELIQALRSMAQAHGMDDRTDDSTIPQTLAYFARGKDSYAALGARRHREQIVLDVMFRTAGAGGELERTFLDLEEEVQRVLNRLYGNSVHIERNPSKMIPLFGAGGS